MTVTYDNASFTYDASNLTYEGVASYVQVLSFTLNPTTARTLGMGFTRAATAPVSTALVRGAALTRNTSLTVTSDMLLTAARVFASTATTTLTAVRTSNYVRTLSSGLTAASAVIVAFPLAINWIVTATAAKTIDIVKTAFGSQATVTMNQTRQAGLPKASTVTVSTTVAKATNRLFTFTANISSAVTKATSTLRTFTTNITNSINRYFIWNVTGTVDAEATLNANGVKVMDTTATLSSNALLESLPTNVGAARDIARDGTHDEAVLTYDRNGNQLYLPVRPTSTL